MRKNSIKNTRINGEVQKELSMIIHGGLKDPRIHPMTSVTGVSVAPDLKTCKAYISVLGDEQAQKDTLEGLRSAEGYIRRELAQLLGFKTYADYVLKHRMAGNVRGVYRLLNDLIDQQARHFGPNRYIF